MCLVLLWLLVCLDCFVLLQLLRKSPGASRVTSPNWTQLTPSAFRAPATDWTSVGVTHLENPKKLSFAFKNLLAASQ